MGAADEQFDFYLGSKKFLLILEIERKKKKPVESCLPISKLFFSDCFARRHALHTRHSLVMVGIIFQKIYFRVVYCVCF